MLINLCNYKKEESKISISQDFRPLQRLSTDMDIIIPLQSSMTVALPTSKNDMENHEPFSTDIPMISGFVDTVDVMNSLQRPKKLTMIGSDGKRYSFLCKPEDDLRKDSRLMELNSIINKLFRKDPETRKRGLRIKILITDIDTYAVIPLNEKCGLIEWVPNTVGFRTLLTRAYQTKGIYMHHADIKQMMSKSNVNLVEVFVKEILPKHPPLFHEWFLEQFPDPSQWLSSRQKYSTSVAAMSMVGYIVGLGDRHGENILFNEKTGACLHVDLNWYFINMQLTKNSLFEKGLEFEVPEKVPFRLTQNMVDALGITGVEGVEILI